MQETDANRWGHAPVLFLLFDMRGVQAELALGSTNAAGFDTRNTGFDTREFAAEAEKHLKTACTHKQLERNKEPCFSSSVPKIGIMELVMEALNVQYMVHCRAAVTNKFVFSLRLIQPSYSGGKQGPSSGANNHTNHTTRQVQNCKTRPTCTFSYKGCKIKSTFEHQKILRGLVIFFGRLRLHPTSGFEVGAFFARMLLPIIAKNAKVSS